MNLNQATYLNSCRPSSASLCSSSPPGYGKPCNFSDSAIDFENLMQHKMPRATSGDPSPRSGDANSMLLLTLGWIFENTNSHTCITYRFQI